MRTTLMLVAIAFALSNSVNASENNKDVTTAINDAKAAQKETAKLGFEWRDTDKIIKQAELAAKDGKNKQAIKLATIIIDQLPAVRKQAAIAKNAGPRF